MHEAVYWFGFIGAWLLFAGPVYQSALELQEEEEARTRMSDLIDTVGRSFQVSPWWWLLPPVAIAMIFRSRAGYRREVEKVMTDEDRQVMGHYSAVARGWWYVGAGAWFIFLKEAWELAEHREWTNAGYWVVVVVLTMVGLGGGGARAGSDARNRGRRQART
ncbi:MAG: hypothetical protein ABIO16_12985 [Nocardioides sp.]